MHNLKPSFSTGRFYISSISTSTNIGIEHEQQDFTRRLRARGERGEKTDHGLLHAVDRAAAGARPVRDHLQVLIACGSRQKHLDAHGLRLMQRADVQAGEARGGRLGQCGKEDAKGFFLQSFAQIEDERAD